MKKLFICLFGLMLAMPAMARTLSTECVKYQRRSSNQGDCYKAEEHNNTYIVTRCHDDTELESIFKNSKGEKVRSFLVQDTAQPKNNHCFYENNCKRNKGYNPQKTPDGKMLHYWFDENGIGLTDGLCIDKCTANQIYDDRAGQCVEKAQQSNETEICIDYYDHLTPMVTLSNDCCTIPEGETSCEITITEYDPKNEDATFLGWTFNNNTYKKNDKVVVTNSDAPEIVMTAKWYTYTWIADTNMFKRVQEAADVCPSDSQPNTKNYEIQINNEIQNTYPESFEDYTKSQKKFCTDNKGTLIEKVEGNWIIYTCYCNYQQSSEIQGTVVTSTETQKQQAITTAVSALDKIFAGVKPNKWRDSKGNFNTARLASDMTAGVVLGTAGALITSNIVKKNQVESGFEDIQCTISGQNVAGFGDEFTVGVK